ncbi:GNAT family N-acetyltransferase [Actinotalea sp. M2MS4P-6]|uniref:GNAT family N-acetyltransferase n=1 Tax=Actinotalea sp. M2MS4P-6 TaxID=2983762 RepID=UPI0021E4D139|nr:GNAT family N-acetyltransferase [Actinotalea sp. M2MS4P-6]MCV2392999.1 GNAT family N-acetyltransferase [Actinotalea sp. M2MS4P-6]
MAPWTVTHAATPPSLDHADAWALHGLELASRRCERALWGHEDHTYRAASALGRLLDRSFAEHHYLVATPPEGVGDPGAVDGFAAMMMPRGDNAHLAWLDVWVRPERRREGLGRRLLGEVEAIARADGRTTFLLATAHAREAPTHDADALVPPTGAGRIRASDAAARFALRAGYRLEQGERLSILRIPVRPEVLDPLHAGALTAAGDAYRPVAWVGDTPDEMVDDVALLLTHAGSDAPTAGLDLREDRWTAERVRQHELQARTAGRRIRIVGALHEASGRLVGLTTVSTNEAVPEAVEQGYTIVLAEHRGHRLGMLVKAEMLRLLGDDAPLARRLRTSNAEENAHMLAINVALGFRPHGVHGMWQKVAR